MSSDVHTELIFLLYHFTSSVTRAWKLYQNCAAKDDDLDLMDERDRITSKLSTIHEEILHHTKVFDWTKESSNKLFREVLDLEAAVFRYQETTGTRTRINLQNKMILELEAYKTS